MANPEHLAILKHGVELWHRWQQEFPELTPDLQGSDMQSVNLAKADVSGPDFEEADLPMRSPFSQTSGKRIPPMWCSPTRISAQTCGKPTRGVQACQAPDRPWRRSVPPVLYGLAQTKQI